MKAYFQKIREEGVKNFNQFLLLLKEETIFFRKFPPQILLDNQENFFLLI